MPKNPSSKQALYQHKKIKGAFIILLATVITLGANAFLVHQERTYSQAPPTAPTSDAATNVPTNVSRYTMSDVRKHNTPDDCWMAAYGNVYDLTEYVTADSHPGGQGSLTSGCGEEVTDSFDRIHSTSATERLEDFLIGVLADA